MLKFWIVTNRQRYASAPCISQSRWFLQDVGRTLFIGDSKGESASVFTVLAGYGSCSYESKSPFPCWLSFRRYSQLDRLSKPATANVILHDLNFSHVFLCIVLTTAGEISFERLIWFNLIYLDNLSCFLQHNLHSLKYMYDKVNSVTEENICSF